MCELFLNCVERFMYFINPTEDNCSENFLLIHLYGHYMKNNIMRYLYRIFQMSVSNKTQILKKGKESYKIIIQATNNYFIYKNCKYHGRNYRN